MTNDTASDIAPACPLCGTQMQAWLTVPGDWRLPDSGRVFEVYWCQQDAFGKVFPSPSKAVLSEHYAINNYYTHSQTDQEASRSSSALEKLRDKIAFTFDRGLEDSYGFLAQKLAGKKARVLEIGSGNAQKLLALREHGHDCMGIEPDPNAKSRQPGFAVPVFAGTAEDPPAALTGQKFDCIIMNHVFEHCIDPVAALGTVHSLLADGGFAFIEVPNIQCADFRFSKLEWPHLDVPRHLNFFSAKSLHAVVAKAGFSIQKLAFAHYNRQVKKEWIDFNKPIVDFYRRQIPSRRSPKDFGALYYWGLLAITAPAPKTFKYDSVIVVINKA